MTLLSHSHKRFTLLMVTIRTGKRFSKCQWPIFILDAITYMCVCVYLRMGGDWGRVDIRFVMMVIADDDVRGRSFMCAQEKYLISWSYSQCAVLVIIGVKSLKAIEILEKM